VCGVDELARICDIGVATLYRQFREMTTMTPIQYQKLLRLHAARRLMLSEELDAASAAIRVRYESPTQFSRDYRRLFGQPPRRDIAAMRNGRPAATACPPR
jgi:AraC-like DNA-binding protein